MRVLCTMGVFTEKGVELYGAGRIALALRARPSLRDNVTTLSVLLLCSTSPIHLRAPR